MENLAYLCGENKGAIIVDIVIWLLEQEMKMDICMLRIVVTQLRLESLLKVIRDMNV